MSGYRLYVHDADLGRVGEFSPVKLVAVLRFNGVSSWVCDMDPDDERDALLSQERAGIVLTKDGVTDPLIAGPAWRRESDRRALAGRAERTLSYSGVSDDVWLKFRLAYPDPAEADPNAHTVANDIRTAAAETLIKGYVDDNCGPSALAARRAAPYDRLTIETDQLRGSTFKQEPRFTPLDELCTAICDRDGDGTLGWRIVRVDDAMQLRVYEPTNRAAEVVYAFERGSLAQVKRVTKAPEVTHALVAGGGEGTARVFSESTEASAWGRLERFVDRRDTSDAAVLTSAGVETLNADKPLDIAELVSAEATALTFPEKFGLGDTISAVVEGVTFTAVVRQVTLTLERGKAPRAVPAFGPFGFGRSPDADVRRRLGQLETAL